MFKKVSFKMTEIIVLICFILLIFLLFEIILRLVINTGSYKPSENPKIIYELIPHYKYSGDRFNSKGLRDYEYSENKPENVFRIVGIGDSHMFGLQVKMTNIFLKKLEHLLNKNTPSIKYEVINFSVPGHNTAMEAETLKSKCLKYNPDLVILQYCGNDSFLPNFIQPEKTILNYLIFHSEFLYSFIRIFVYFLDSRSTNSKLSVFIKKKILNFDYYYNVAVHPHRGLQHVPVGSIGTNPINEKNKAPERYRWMMEWDGYENALIKISEISKLHNIPVIIIGLFYPPHKKLFDRLGLYSMNFSTVWDKFLMKNKLKMTDLELSKTDSHPNMRGHEVIAEALYNYLNKHELINIKKEDKYNNISCPE